ncbi:alpha/beta hydrolase [Campylobacter anatolicus]|uniref:alpha/beta hydrolase n=1 Tax=Campylobacter anatolicus TaxID=2829105 RepID=UPI001E4D4520|nr:alpha/beta hydrolase [Campylobacter anatolicus]
MKRRIFISTAVAMLVGAKAMFADENSKTSKDSNTQTNKPRLETTWDKIFAKSDKVEHKKVQFKNRYGIILVADLYVPKNLKGKAPALAVSGPFGAVKEQVSGLYAQNMAKRGYITLAFDPSYIGESGGEPRNIASPEINTEDFSAAVDYLTTLSNVDSERIGVIGICGFGGFAINAAVIDTRIKATVASTMYDMTRVMANGYNDSINAEQRYEIKERLNAIRTQDAKSGKMSLGDKNLPDKLNGDEPKFVAEYYDFYKTKRGFHKRSYNSNGAWSATMSLPFINMPILQRSNEIKNAVMILHGEIAHSRYFGEDAFKKLVGENKELLIVPNANHVDLYDGGKNGDKIPFDKIDEFFAKNLK